MISRRKAVILAIVLSLALSLATYTAVSAYYRILIYGSVPTELRHLDFEKFAKIMHLINTRYLKETTPEAVMEGVFKGMLMSLGDPYSAYLDASQYRDMLEKASGTYSGIGVYIGQRGGFITIIAPIKGTPAERGGLLSGDRIVQVDGKDIVGVSVDEAVQLIRGREGTPVRLTIVREGNDRTLEVEIVRATVEVNPVEYEMVGADIGYIRLTVFNEHASANVKSAIEELKARGAKAFILDLRQNPGMLLDQCLEVAEFFIPQGPIVHTVYRDGTKETFSSKTPGLNMPLVVLIDQGTASASEIVAGAIQDSRAGILVGTRTFGKGLVQSLIDLRDGTAVKLTTSKYLTPAGRDIHDEGISPDIQVNLEEGETPRMPSQGLDRQVEAAITVLRSQLKAGS